MAPLLPRLLALGFAGSLLIPLWGCELEECDPDTDPTCNEPDGGSPTDVGGNTDAAPVPTATYRYVWILDATPSPSGSHPGADIDAVEVVRNGTSHYARAVTDWTTASMPNSASDERRVTSGPNVGASGPECAMNRTPAHWYSLGGEYVVVDLGATGAVRDGDTLTIYECPDPSGTGDTYDVYLGTTPRVDGGEWIEVATNASGTAVIPIRF